ncbi:protein CONSERVED ONLY IN THE GREEN LINEAGE 160, chloroplastic [Heracleum sosnowskyi]|uniref:Protein CONSERVED ONLY IN THE GREEN LINEAGE 160, chloroplastic n=1 Tax=Heracleum sosnowskyi TaxID=360622 RepID=A0AAD8J738_9APIA|nr:protein CONSERVED ONLY IN THE GREEN LINEAGE 160, chloroplastic [Heracleum sosnowskyi]
MASSVYCCVSITCTAKSISPEETNTIPVSNTKPTKIMLPKKKPEKWSTGMAPGEYGGPPLTTKLRKSWGGPGEDPITSDEYIWNKDFMPRMKRLFKDPSQEAQLNKPQEESSGFLSLNRVMSLDNMDADFSKELTAPSKIVTETKVERAQTSGDVKQKWRPAPTRREQDKWDRAYKAATGGSEFMLREIKKPVGDPEVLAAESREQYLKLKNKMQLLTLGIGGIGLVSAYVSYTPEIAASYGVGFLGSLAYIRMLGNSVDSMADGARGVVKGAIGQPRLLVPVVLVMIFNRWNGILVPEYGIMHLELIPILVGFFTYKIATFTQAIEEAVTIVGKKSQV